jgi:hypothetical protein
VRDANGQALAYVYFEEDAQRPSRSRATKPGASPPMSPSCRICCTSRETPETTSGLLWPVVGPSAAKRLSAKLTGDTAGKPDGPAHRSLPGRRSRPRGRKPLTRSARGCGSLSPAARRSSGCGSLTIGEHLKLVLSNRPAEGALSLPEHRFPSPWSVDEQEACFTVRDANGQALAYVYFEDEPGRRADGQARCVMLSPICV